MKKISLIILANTIFLIHSAVVLIAFFGWLFPKIWIIYMAVLILTLLSDIIFGYCILSKFEFAIRKKNNPKTDYNYTFSSYYTYKLTNQRISDKFIINIAYIFLTGSILINLFFKFIY